MALYTSPPHSSFQVLANRALLRGKGSVARNEFPSGPLHHHHHRVAATKFSIVTLSARTIQVGCRVTNTFIGRNKATQTRTRASTLFLSLQRNMLMGLSSSLCLLLPSRLARSVWPLLLLLGPISSPFWLICPLYIICSQPFAS